MPKIASFLLKNRKNRNPHVSPILLRILHFAPYHKSQYFRVI